MLYFPVSDPDVARITSALKSSLQHTFEAFPILSGTAQQQTARNKQSGSLCVGAPWNEIEDVFHVKDLTSSDLDYETLRRNHFPMIPSQKDLMSVYYSRPNPPGLENPVMMAQVNFVRNGMILVQFLHHSVMDGLGGATVMGMWATFCREKNGAGIINSEMMNRGRLMSGDDNARLEDFREYVDHSGSYERGINSSHTNSRDTSFSVSSTPQRPKEVDTEIFFFPRSKLADLKSAVSVSLANAAISSSDSKIPSYISTNDALSALLFACITEARKPFNSTDSQQRIPFGLTVSGRRLLDPPLSDKYIGNMSFFCYLDVPLSNVTPETHRIAAVAGQIRNRLLQLDDNYVKRLIGALHAVEDLGKLIKCACHTSKDWPFLVTPWTGQGFYNMDWGRDIGVKCERVRIPKVSYPHLDGMNVVLPELKGENNTDGEEEAGLEVVVYLEKVAMQRLRDMSEWTRWAQWRCS